ncbi:MAG TPA: FAD-dependent thymidylate synthase [Abditibacteriaceae bacterium]|jgi:thymidylate synthase ThyX
MKITHAAICPTDAAREAGRPALTPELLAASGARYSRNNEGLDSILSKIDPNNLDKSVDGIFKMIDYGHQSIADMAPVAMFIDGVSLALAYIVWSLAPTAGGQESSTRYINYAGGVVDADVLGIPAIARDAWQKGTTNAFAAYDRALELWTELAQQQPELTRIPRSLREDTSDRAQKTVARMERNYAFDRARVFLPVAAPTNLMLVMSARGWVNLAQHLLSHPLPEARALGEGIREELPLAAPRLLRHATAKPSMEAGQKQQWEKWMQSARDELEITEAPPTAHLEVAFAEGDFASALEFHDNRYAWIGEDLQHTVVRFGWDAVAIAEIRDLNRHRTGTKSCPLVPVGFYSASDQWPATAPKSDVLEELKAFGENATQDSRAQLAGGEATGVYHALLGTQYRFTHVTTADKFLYEAELRTGTGAHYRYARHLHDALELWYQKFSATRGLVLEGSAEPE